MTTAAPSRHAEPGTDRPSTTLPSPSSARWDAAPQYLLAALFHPTRLTSPASRTLTSGALFGWTLGGSLVAFAASLPAILPILERDISTALQATGATQGANLAAWVVAFSLAASTATAPIITALVILLAGLLAGRSLAWRHAFRAAVVGSLPLAVVKPVATLVQVALLPLERISNTTALSLGPVRWLSDPSLPPGQTILLHHADLPTLWGALLVGLCLTGVPDMPKRDAWLMAAYAWAIGLAMNLVPALL